MTALLDGPVRTRTAASYSTLTTQQQTDWDQLESDTWTHYQQAATQPVDHTAIQARHALLATQIGITLGPGDELVQCDCENCPDGCDDITALAKCAEYVNSLGQQAPRCGTCDHDHGTTDGADQ